MGRSGSKRQAGKAGKFMKAEDFHMFHCPGRGPQATGRQGHGGDWKHKPARVNKTSSSHGEDKGLAGHEVGPSSLSALERKDQSRKG